MDNNQQIKTTEITVTISVADWFTTFTDDLFNVLQKAVANGMTEDKAIEVAEDALRDAIAGAIKIGK